MLQALYHGSSKDFITEAVGTLSRQQQDSNTAAAGALHFITAAAGTLSQEQQGLYHGSSKDSITAAALYHGSSKHSTLRTLSWQQQALYTQHYQGLYHGSSRHSITAASGTLSRQQQAL